MRFCAVPGGPQRMPLLSTRFAERRIAPAAKGVLRAWKQSRFNLAVGSHFVFHDLVEEPLHAEPTR